MSARIVLTHSIFHFGSTEHYVLELVRRLDPARFDVRLVVPDDDRVGPLRSLEQAVPVPSSAFASAPRAIAVLSRTLRRLRPDVVHVVDVDPAALLAARLAGVFRVVVTHHTPELPRTDNALGRALLRAAWATRPHVVYTSEQDRARFGGGERADVIPLAIDLERFAPRAGDGRVRRELGLDDATPLVGTVGILKEQKRHDLLIEAARRIDAAVAIAGDGPLRAALAARIRSAGLGDRVFLLGHRDDVPEVLADLDVFALSSDYEGLCLAVAEALAVGTPVVATGVGGVPQTVVDGETGLLVPRRDPGALARGITTVLDDRELASRLADAGRERVRRLYALDSMVAATSALYERLLAT